MNIIVCCDNNYGIGYCNNIPWDYTLDKLFFYDKTIGNVVIMGNNTYKSLGSELKNRVNIIISNSNSLENGINVAKEYNLPIFIIGGEMIYTTILKSYASDISNVYVTKLNKTYICDKFYPINLHNNLNFNKQIILTTNDAEFIHYSKSTDNISERHYQELIYLNILKKTLSSNNFIKTRNGFVYSLFGDYMEFNLNNNIFPILTTKKIVIKNIFEELMFFIRGQYNTSILYNKGVHIWDDNTKNTNGDMGPMYGYNWRNFGKYNDNKGVDQLQYCMDLLLNDPHNRRIIMTSFDPFSVDKCVLYPCHGLVIQFYNNDDKISLHMYQRSADLFLGLPYNITSYALLLYLICSTLTKSSSNRTFIPDRLIISLGDMHIYEEHIEQVYRQLLRNPYDFPNIYINGKNNICEYEMNDIDIINYKHHGFIKAQMIV